MFSDLNFKFESIFLKLIGKSLVCTINNSNGLRSRAFINFYGQKMLSFKYTDPWIGYSMQDRPKIRDQTLLIETTRIFAVKS